MRWVLFSIIKLGADNLVSDTELETLAASLREMQRHFAEIWRSRANKPGVAHSEPQLRWSDANRNGTMLNSPAVPSSGFRARLAAIWKQLLVRIGRL